MVILKLRYSLISFFIFAALLISCIKKGDCGAEFDAELHGFDTSFAFHNQMFYSDNDSMEFEVVEPLLNMRDTMTADINLGGSDCEVGMSYGIWRIVSGKKSREYILVWFMANVTALGDKKIQEKTKDFTFRVSTECGDGCSFFEQEVNNLKEVNLELTDVDEKKFIERISLKEGYVYQFEDSTGVLWTSSKWR